MRSIPFYRVCAVAVSVFRGAMAVTVKGPL